MERKMESEMETDIILWLLMNQRAYRVMEVLRKENGGRLNGTGHRRAHHEAWLAFPVNDLRHGLASLRSHCIFDTMDNCKQTTICSSSEIRCVLG